MSEQEARPGGVEARPGGVTLVSQANDASFKLIALALFTNAETTELVQTGVTLGGKAVGDWKITVQKLGVLEDEPEQLEMFPGVPASGPGHGDS